MAGIYVSGLINTETNVRIQEFPIPCFPIDCPSFGVRTAVSGVAQGFITEAEVLRRRQ